MDWTASQREVLEAQGNLLVVGAPGTGKTTVALAKAMGRIDGGLSSHERVLFLSFSTAAVRRIAAAARLTMTRDQRHLIDVTTVHALCREMLVSHGAHAGLPSPFSLLAPQAVRLLRAEAGDEEVLGKLIEIERSEGRVSFGRFAPLAIEVLTAHPVLRDAYSRAYPLILVDEYQDTGEAQNDLIMLLAGGADLICLGDPDQRIYDFRADVRSDRLDRLKDLTSVREIVLRGMNHRSGGTDLLDYARSVLTAERMSIPASTVRVWKVFNQKQLVTRLPQALMAMERDIRKVRGALRARCYIAIMARSNAQVARISAALATPTPGFPSGVFHQVLVDTADLAFAWRVALRALEHDADDDVEECVASVLALTAELEASKGMKTSSARAAKLATWAEGVSLGRLSARVRFVPKLRDGLQALAGGRSGSPEDDLVAIRGLFRSLPGGHFDRVVAVLDLRLPAGRFEAATGVLTELYGESRSYKGAAEVVDRALVKEGLLGDQEGRAPRVVMTLHRCKGKEFDGVLIIDPPGPSGRLAGEGDDLAPYSAPRRLLHVGLTRARYRAFIFTPGNDPCPLLP